MIIIKLKEQIKFLETLAIKEKEKAVIKLE